MSVPPIPRAYSTECSRGRGQIATQSVAFELILADYVEGPIGGGSHVEPPVAQLVASGYLTPNGIVVLAGSEAVLKERTSAKKWPSVMIQRNRLIEEAGLVPKDDKYIFVKDTEFYSPSAAAAVIHGGSTNGLTAWINKSGKSLKELQNV